MSRGLGRVERTVLGCLMRQQHGARGLSAAFLTHVIAYDRGTQVTPALRVALYRALASLTRKRLLARQGKLWQLRGEAAKRHARLRERWNREQRKRERARQRRDATARAREIIDAYHEGRVELSEAALQALVEIRNF